MEMNVTGPWIKVDDIPENVEFRGTFSDGELTETVLIKLDGAISRPGNVQTEPFPPHRIAQYAPFVPAGWWRQIEDVPGHITRARDTKGDLWIREGDDWFSVCQLHNPAEFAPFVAAEEVSS